jgi:PAS domain S-box-containing protein
MDAKEPDEAALRAEIAELKLRLEESEETLSAIRSGEVDALVIGDQIYTLESADAASNRFRGEIIDQISDIVIALDEDVRLTYINPAGEKKYGVTAANVLGQRARSVFTNKFIGPETEEEARKSFEAEGYWCGESIHLRLDGSEFHAETAISRLYDGAKAACGMLAIIRDITRRKEAEEQLRHANEQLEARVLERTSELEAANVALREEVVQRRALERQRGHLLQRVVSSQEDERGRIARDIHDKLGQRVTVLRLHISLLAHKKMGAEEMDSTIEMLNLTASKLDRDVSFLAWDLRPAALDDLGLEQAARTYLDDWSHVYRISSEFSASGDEGGRTESRG